MIELSISAIGPGDLADKVSNARIHTPAQAERLKRLNGLLGKLYGAGRRVAARNHVLGGFLQGRWSLQTLARPGPGQARYRTIE